MTEGPCMWYNGNRRELNSMEKPEERICPKCGITKPLTPEYFYRNRAQNLGFDHYCKICKSEARNKRYKEDPKYRTHVLEVQKKWREGHSDK